MDVGLIPHISKRKDDRIGRKKINQRNKASIIFVWPLFNTKRSVLQMKAARRKTAASQFEVYAICSDVSRFSARKQ